MMQPTDTKLEDRPIHRTRLIGRARGARPGPSLIIVGGVHGNEPAGVRALHRVIDRLAVNETPMCGDLFAVAGNLAGLEAGKRFIDEDLNRIWTRAHVERARGTEPATTSEQAEQRELLSVLTSALEDARGQKYFLDLHTTSASGAPFSIASGQGPDRDFALSFPQPVVLGLVGTVDGFLLDFMKAHGCISVGVEAGQNESPTSVDRHEAVIWSALVSAGLVADDAVAPLADYRRLLSDACADLPSIVDVVNRHAISADDQFRMRPGYANLHPVERGELLAHDRHGEIRASEDGFLLMPLYQALGQDGFFFARAVS